MAGGGLFGDQHLLRSFRTAELNRGRADRDGSAGNYTYKNVTITGDDGENVTLDMLELKGAHMDGELAAFDAISFGGLSAKNDDDNADVKIAKIELIKPTPALANAFARTFGGDEDAFDNIEGPVGFSGFNLVDAKITSDDGNGALKSMSFGESSDKTGVFSMKGLDFSTTKDANVSMSLGSIEGTGLNIEKYKGFFEEGFKSGKNGDEISEDAMKSIMQSMNMYDPDFRTASIKDFDMNVEGLTVDFDAITAKADSKGGKTTITQSISPVTITPPANPGAEMKEFAEALSTMGYDKMVFSTSQKSVLDESTDSMKVTDSYIELQDGFKLAFDYDLIGYKAMMEKATAMGADGNDDPMAGLEVLSEMKFNDFAISFSDNSIIDRAFKLAASQQGGTPDALKNQAKIVGGWADNAAPTTDMIPI